METFIIVSIFSLFFIISMVSKASQRQKEAARQHQEYLDQKRIQFGPDTNTPQKNIVKDFGSSRETKAQSADSLAKAKHQKHLRSKEAELYDQDDFFAKYDKLFDDDK